MTDRDGGPPPDELADRLDDLEDALSELRAELDGEAREPGVPRPPRPSELLRFTERYTIPTVIALLEATVRSLELLRGALRLADPERDLSEGDRPASADRLDVVRGEASDRLAGSLRELRRALSTVDLPSEPESRSIIEEARELSAEIERRLDDDATAGKPAAQGGGAGDDGTGGGPVRIDVTGADDDGDADDSSGGPDDGGAKGGADHEDNVDVEAELRTLKRQYRTDDELAPDTDSESDTDTGSDSEPNADADSRPDADPAESDDGGDTHSPDPHASDDTDPSDSSTGGSGDDDDGAPGDGPAGCDG